MHPGLIFGVIIFILCAGIAAVLSIFMNILIGLSAAAGALILAAGFYLYCGKSNDEWLSLIMITVGGVILGASTGAIVGSLVPGPGTVLCAALGGLVGLIFPLTVFLYEILKPGHSFKFSARYDGYSNPSNFNWGPDNSLSANNSISNSLAMTTSKPGIHFFQQLETPATNTICPNDYNDVENNLLKF